ncbi:Zinc finger protein 182 [Araneus ventricosus]|uniref:Zinc finger protein 182 n=1 Tax=Araneus ventricosus TaxID=182803 RepID=A0A4Y2GHI1_ARAVE|nr:Zinc finger protein 182 [Araneus ventricosus]
MTDICGVPNVLELNGKGQNDADSLSPSKSYGKRAEYCVVANCKTKSSKRDEKFTAGFHRWNPHSCVRNARRPAAWDTRWQRGSNHLMHVMKAIRFFIQDQVSDFIHMHIQTHSHTSVKNAERVLYLNPTKHPDERPHECVICQLSFKFKSGLSTHMNMHEEQKCFRCEKCDKIFPSKSYLKGHMAKHSEKRPQECNVCQLSFKFKQSLNLHMNVHDEQSPFRCEQCNRICFPKSHLKVHMRKHSD